MQYKDKIMKKKRKSYHTKTRPQAPPEKKKKKGIANHQTKQN